MTIDRAKISLGKSDGCPALAYVALSRVRTKEGLLIDPLYFDAQRLTGVKLQNHIIQFELETELLIKKTNIMLDFEESVLNKPHIQSRNEEIIVEQKEIEYEKEVQMDF